MTTRCHNNVWELTPNGFVVFNGTAKIGDSLARIEGVPQALDEILQLIRLLEARLDSPLWL